MDNGTPRRTIEPDPVRQIMGLLGDVANRVSQLERGSTLRNASVSGGQGLRIIDEAGNVRISLSATNDIVAYDDTQSPVVRMGRMRNSGPATYGVEVQVGTGSWVQLGAQNVAWENIGAIPSTYDPGTRLWTPRPHTHTGSDITSMVGQASYASQADGSQYGWSNNVGGTQFYALWVGNDGGYRFGRNTSSIRYKQNVRDITIDVANVLKLQPRIFDRKPTGEGPAATNEFGLIAEEVQLFVPEIVTWFEGQIDGVRYDLLAVALIPVAKDHEQRIQVLEAQVKQLTQALGGKI